MRSLFAFAFGLGIAFAAPPGAVTAEAVRRGVRGGFWPCLRVELGSLAGDAAWAIASLSGAAVVVRFRGVRLALGVTGTAVLIALAVAALRSARRGLPDPAPAAGQRRRGDLAAGAALSLASPYAAAFWLGVGGAMTAAGVPAPGPRHFAVFFAGFMLAMLAWSFGFAALMAGGRRLVGATALRWVSLGCAVVFVAFAVRLAVLTATSW